MKFQPSTRRSEVMKRIGVPLRIQPILFYELPKRKEGDSWRPWTGIQTEEDVNNEVKQIQQELQKLKIYADFSVSLLPLMEVNSDEKARQASKSDCDVILLYAASGSGRERINIIITTSRKPVIMFLRHKSGPLSYYYEGVHQRVLRYETDTYDNPNLNIEDVVVDDYNEVIIRLRALYGLKNVMNTKLLAINGIGAFNEKTDHVKKVIKDIWHLDVKEIEMNELQLLFKKKSNDNFFVNKAENDMKEFLANKFILSVNTKKEFVLRAFLLYHTFKDLMEKHEAQGITVRGCMGIGRFVGTTACLPFGLINDEGLMAFCESDFIAIPCFILLRHISGKPVFMNDPAYPHDGEVTCAHCSSPMRMDGTDFEPTHIYTHYESDYGAAPKVEYRKGQVITNINPDFEFRKWVGFKGTIADHPFLPICRSQFECSIEGSWEKLLKEMRGFHWLTCYGDYLKEMAYATKKVGIEFENISEQV